MRVPGSDSYLTGIIDLVLRVRKGDGSYIYYILDWKTTSVNGDYFRESLELSMREKKYKLQYELYSLPCRIGLRTTFRRSIVLVDPYIFICVA